MRGTKDTAFAGTNLHLMVAAFGAVSPRLRAQLEADKDYKFLEAHLRSDTLGTLSLSLDEFRNTVYYKTLRQKDKKLSKELVNYYILEQRLADKYAAKFERAMKKAKAPALGTPELVGSALSVVGNITASRKSRTKQGSGWNPFANKNTSSQAAPTVPEATMAADASANAATQQPQQKAAWFSRTKPQLVVSEETKKTVEEIIAPSYIIISQPMFGKSKEWTEISLEEKVRSLEKLKKEFLETTNYSQNIVRAVSIIEGKSRWDALIDIAKYRDYYYEWEVSRREYEDVSPSLDYSEQLRLCKGYFRFLKYMSNWFVEILKGRTLNNDDKTIIGEYFEQPNVRNDPTEQQRLKSKKEITPFYILLKAVFAEEISGNKEYVIDNTETNKYIRLVDNAFETLRSYSKLDVFNGDTSNIQNVENIVSSWDLDAQIKMCSLLETFYNTGKQEKLKLEKGEKWGAPYLPLKLNDCVNIVKLGMLSEIEIMPIYEAALKFSVPKLQAKIGEFTEEQQKLDLLKSLPGGLQYAVRETPVNTSMVTTASNEQVHSAEGEPAEGGWFGAGSVNMGVACVHVQQVTGLTASGMKTICGLIDESKTPLWTGMYAMLKMIRQRKTRKDCENVDAALKWAKTLPHDSLSNQLRDYRKTLPCK
jgi:hypothetical protein